MPIAEELGTGVTVLAAVRAATRSAHVRIESLRPMLRLVSGDYTEREYVRHLSDLLGLYEPLETLLARCPMPLDLDKGRRLRRDLADLGLSAAQIRSLPRCCTLPAAGGAVLLGHRYVYEGASLGGTTIARRLRRSLPDTPAAAFYHADGALTARRWQTFCRHLETSETGSLEAICATAVAVFGTFANWIDGPPASAAVTT